MKGIYGWLRNPAPVEKGGFYIPLFIGILEGFNHPFGGACFLPSWVFRHDPYGLMVEELPHVYPGILELSQT